MTQGNPNLEDSDESSDSMVGKAREALSNDELEDVANI